MTQGSVQKMPGPAMKEVLLIERDECDSTNDYIRRNRKELEAKFPIAVVAAVQTKGRGREGRPWFSARGLGLYASFGFHFGPIQNIPLLSLVAGLAVSDILEEMIPSKCRLKWPNDVLVSNRKIAGILVENLIQGDESVCICGVGININHLPDDFPGDIRPKSTSIAMLTGQEVRIPALVRTLSHVFFSRVSGLAGGNKTEILEQWQRRSHFRIGDRIGLRHQGRRVEGSFAGLDQNGGLCLRLSSGVKKVYHHGEPDILVNRR